MLSNDNRPPFCRFERRPVEDREHSIQAGKYLTKDVDFIILIPHGSEGKTQIEQPYAEWLAKVVDAPGRVLQGPADDPRQPAMNPARFPDEWLERIEKGYAAWKKGEEVPLEGFPVKQATWMTPAQRENCVRLNLLTVEELANASDEAAAYLGIGGITLRQRARDFLKAHGGDAAKNSGEMEALRKSNEALQTQVNEMQKRMDFNKGAKAA